MATVGEAEASERMATRFTRGMRSATSRWGMFTDPPIVCAEVASIVVVAALLYNLDIMDRTMLPYAYAVISLPIVAAVALNFALKKARRELVAWLAGLPFVVDNMNGLLNGVAAHLVVRFESSAPGRQQLSDLLEEIHPDCFALDFHEDEPEVELVIGVADSKINPARASFQRYTRVKSMIDGCLVPLVEKHPIVSVRLA